MATAYKEWQRRAIEGRLVSRLDRLRATHLPAEPKLGNFNGPRNVTVKPAVFLKE